MSTPSPPHPLIAHHFDTAHAFALATNSHRIDPRHLCANLHR